MSIADHLAATLDALTDDGVILDACTPSLDKIRKLETELEILRSLVDVARAVAKDEVPRSRLRAALAVVDHVRGSL